MKNNKKAFVFCNFGKIFVPIMNVKRILFAAFLLSCAGLRAQDIQSLLTKTADFHDSKPVEKIHLQLDKYSYTAGETIWFKAYAAIGVENFLSNLSNIGYVELIGPKSEVAYKLKIPIISGLGVGDITLADTIAEGTYRLRAYTNWMRNDSATWFFEQNVHVSNGRTDNVLTESLLEDGNYAVFLKDLRQRPLEKTSVRYEIIAQGGKSLKKGRLSTDADGRINVPFAEQYANAKLVLSFKNSDEMPLTKLFKLPAADRPNVLQVFAEGGDILAGTLNNIAVKALKPDGKGIAATVYILNGQGDTLSVLETNALGMGAQPVFVDRVDDLAAQAHFADGTVGAVPLPPVKATGRNLIVNNQNPRRLFVQVNLGGTFVDNQDLYFVVHHLGKPFFVSKQKAAKNELVFSVDKKDFPTGVFTVSILNASLAPILERPVFIVNKTSEMPLEISTNGSAFSARQKVEVSVKTGLETDSVRNAALSASVVNLSKTDDDPDIAPSILSNLLLSADIKGYIENPGWYFSPDIRTKDIDALLLTQGWRKIDITADLHPQEWAFKPEKGVTIKGQARKLGRKAPFPNAQMTLVSTQNFMDFIDTVANEEGFFAFGPLFFPDSVKFLITAKDDKGKRNIDIFVPKEERALPGENRNASDELNNVNNVFRDQIVRSKPFFASLETQGLMERMIAIEEVVVTARAPRHKASESSSNLNGPGNADQVLDAEDLETCTTLEMCLNGRLLGVTFQNGRPHTTRGGGEMQVVLDGMYIEGDQLSMIVPQDIQSIEVLRNVNYTAIYGSNGGNGLIIITSKTGRDGMRNYTPKGILTVQPEGLHMAKTFYKPVYEVDSDKQLNQDLRTTIHWEPNIITDGDGKAVFDFYTADEPGKYRITIEGLDFNGRLGRKTYLIDNGQ